MGNTTQRFRSLLARAGELASRRGSACTELNDVVLAALASEREHMRTSATDKAIPGPPLTAGARRVLDRAIRIAVEHGHLGVGGEHVLAAVIADYGYEVQMLPGKPRRER